MGRGPYEKSGMIRDTGLPPLRPVHESFDIPFPFEDIKIDGKFKRNLLHGEMEVEVRLIYIPFGERNRDHFVWYLTKRLISLE